MPHTIRPMTHDDAPAVAEIDRLSNPQPWPKASLAEEVERPLARYLVLEGGDGRIDGFVGLWLMVGEAHITMIAVRPELRRGGLGEALLVAAVRTAIAEQQQVVTLEVRASNAAAIAMYRKYGFVEAGRRPRYYDDNGEDALILTSPPLDSPTYLARFERLAARLTPSGGAGAAD